jgi:excisionase family DNA binding protein
LSREEELIVQSIAERLGDQISRELTVSLAELFSKLRTVSTQPVLQKTRQTLHPDEFLTAIDVAGILKISKGLVYRMIQSRDIPSFTMGKTVRVRRADLDAFIISHMVR